MQPNIKIDKIYCDSCGLEILDGNFMYNVTLKNFTPIFESKCCTDCLKLLEKQAREDGAIDKFIKSIGK